MTLSVGTWWMPAERFGEAWHTEKEPVMSNASEKPDSVDGAALTDCSTVEDIVERIMTAHWDMASCRCWVCKTGRELGLRPRPKWLDHEHDNRQRYPVPSGNWGDQ